MPAISSAWPTRRSRPSRKPLEDLPQTDDKGKASFEVALDKVPATSRPLEAKVIVRLAEAGGRAVERKHHAADRRRRQHDRRQAAVLRPLARRGRERELRRRARRARRQDAGAARGCATSCSRSSRAISSIAATAAGSTSRSSPRAASPTAGSMSRPTSRAASRRRCSGAAIASKCRARDADGPVTSIGFDAGWYTEASADTPDMLEIALDKPEYKPGDADDGRRDRAHRRPRDAQRHGRQAAAAPITQEVTARHRAHPGPGRHRLGHRRLCGGDLAPSARRRRRSACRAAPSACSGSRSTARRRRWRST